MATMTAFEMKPDVFGSRMTLTPPAPLYIDNRVLAANVAETHTIPTGAKVVYFSCTNIFYVNFDGTGAVVPAADITNGTGSFPNPACLYIQGLTSFSLISPAACVIGMAFHI